MKIKKIRKDCSKFIKDHNLNTKWDKCKKFFEENIKHPSLNVELLEPKWRGIYSFRIDKKYRALFFIDDKNRAEVFLITKHYKKK